MSSPSNVSSVTLDPNRNTADVASPGSHQLLLIPANEMERLLREDWPNAKMLAEELYAIYNSGVKQVAQPGQAVLTSPAPGVPALVINAPPDGNGITIRNNKGAVNYGVNGITGIPPAPIVATPGAGGGLPGQVQSGGPGNGPYSVTIYPNGTGSPGTTVNVTQLQIAPTDTVPAGTWVMVMLSPDHTYSMQVPVWLT